MTTRTGNVYNASRQPSQESDEQVEREEAAQSADDSPQTPLPATRKDKAPATQSSQQAEIDALRRMIEGMQAQIDQQRLNETRFQQELERLRSERSSRPQRQEPVEPEPKKILPTIQQAFPEGTGATAFEFNFIC